MKIWHLHGPKPTPNMTTERIKILEAEKDAHNTEKVEIGHQKFSLKVREVAIDKKLKAIEWEIEQLKTLPLIERPDTSFKLQASDLVAKIEPKA